MSRRQPRCRQRGPAPVEAAGARGRRYPVSASDEARRRWTRGPGGPGGDRPASAEVTAYWLARIRAQLRGEPVPEGDPPPGQLGLIDLDEPE
jgi:hypothetical protein